MSELNEPQNNYDPDEYPRALQAIKEMWLPPASVLYLVEQAEKTVGLSNEASTWLRRVKAARQSDTITD